MKIHYNPVALRSRYMLSNDQVPRMTDKRYCQDQGIPENWANTPKIKEHFLSVSENKEEANREYRLLLAQNGLLTEVEDTQ